MKSRKECGQPTPMPSLKLGSQKGARAREQQPASGRETPQRVRCEPKGRVVNSPTLLLPVRRLFLLSYSWHSNHQILRSPDHYLPQSWISPNRISRQPFQVMGHPRDPCKDGPGTKALIMKELLESFTWRTMGWYGEIVWFKKYDRTFVAQLVRFGSTLS